MGETVRGLGYLSVLEDQDFGRIWHREGVLAKYFVIGSGSIGRRHAANLSHLGKEVEILPWRSVDLDALRKSLMTLKGDVGLVIATATDVRAPLIDLCTQTSCPVYIEKPVGVLDSDLTALKDMPERLKKRSMAGFMMRYHPITQFLYKHVPTNCYRSSFQVGSDVNSWRKNWQFDRSYAAKLVGGGVLLDLCHEIDLAWLLHGRLKADSVDCLSYPGHPKIDASTRVVASGSEGEQCNIVMDYLAPSLLREGQLVGVKEILKYSFVTGNVQKITDRGIDNLSFKIERNSMFIDAAKDFVNLVENATGSSNPCSPRLDLVMEQTKFIASCWRHRRFSGSIGVA